MKEIKMKKQILLILFSVISLLSQGQTKIEGIVFPNTINAGKDKLVLNGGGMREKYWIDMYVGALYLSVKSKEADKIISSNTSQSIKICIVSSLITSESMLEAVDEGFVKSTGGKQATYKNEIATFKKAFSNTFAVGDVFDIVYTADKLSIYKNNVLKSEIAGLEFKKAVFGIWLGKDPADDDLKDGMLGL
jgi:hypothetical protein